MKLAGNAPETDRFDQNHPAVADVQICFAYRHANAPLDGSNNFARVLRECISRTPGFAIVDDLQGEYDVLFMNQLSRSPGRPYALSEVREALDGARGKKMVVRAINLQCNRPHEDSNQQSQDYEMDKPVLDLLNMADFVIFQSNFQKSFFDHSGYRGKNDAVIHNGAAPIFLNVPGGAKRLNAGDDLILVSAAMAKIAAKRHDIIAGFSRVPGVKVIHCGVWPESLDRGNVEMAGALSHNTMAQLYARGHYFLHPAVYDVCPNSLVEGLCAGLPAIYNPGAGSGNELAGKYGVSLEENELPGTIARARAQYVELATALAPDRHYYSIDRAASDYMLIFRSVAQG